MDVGTGKVSPAERARIPHHLIDVVEPDEEMTAARYAALSDAAIAETAARGKPVVVAGGTGLYVRALMHGLFAGPPADPELRATLEREDAGALHERLRDVDPVAAGRILPNDRRRLIRALEVHTLTGVPISTHQRAHDVKNAPSRYPARWVGLDPPAAELRARIAARVDAMLAAGFVDEVRRLAARFSLALRAFDAIGYREIGAHLRGEIDLPTAREKMIAATRRYARRQRGWFRAEPGVAWHASADSVDVSALAGWLLDRETVL
jgi:tRNA dimethylallyltransferase